MTDKMKKDTGEDRKKTKKKKKPTSFLWILGTFLVLLLGLAIIAVALGLNHPYFDIDREVVKGNITKTDDEIIDIIGLKDGENIFKFDAKKAEAKLKNEGDYSSVEVKKQLPDTLLIDIVEKETIGYVNVKNGYLLVGADLKIKDYTEDLKDEEKDNLIRIINAGYDELTIGNKVTALSKEEDFLRNLTNHPLASITKEVDFGGEAGKATMLIKPNILVNFGDLKENDYKIALLERVVEDIQKKDIKAKEIILDSTPNPIVVTE